MSQETLTQLSAAVKSDRDLEAKLRTAKTFDDVVSIAAQHGHAVTLEDLRASAARLEERELSDDDLASVSAGKGKKQHKDPQPYFQLVMEDLLVTGV
jgi:predicted ribosomally synthesized peptide with nif11-like leader